ncbi:polysaccharide pyruvyl transferase family protein [Parapedobacter sp. DT-150]|uniref:polysaccharide pyruvyl transferase family protein n=1 Tax=Parapedobacter sp. DT-150 TaxID=3396162 RepID=UPI003F194506
MEESVTVSHALIAQLRTGISQALTPLIDRDFVLLDVPNHRNIGDNLIWKGELEFFAGLPCRMRYTANMHTCRFDRVPADATILLHGGGNFGDLYRESQRFKLSVIGAFRRQRIILLPQTAHYTDPALLERDARTINAHRDLFLCLRDRASFGLLSRYVAPEKLLLLPDMAFCLDFSAHRSTARTGRALILKRTDHELGDRFSPADFLADCAGKIVDIRDWPTYGISREHTRWMTRLDRVERKLSEWMVGMPGLQGLVDPAFGLRSRGNLDRYVQQGIAFINRYDNVVTTRLHGFILAALLGKPVRMVDNSYGKNKHFFDTWLRGPILRDLTISDNNR